MAVGKTGAAPPPPTRITPATEKKQPVSTEVVAQQKTPAWTAQNKARPQVAGAEQPEAPAAPPYDARGQANSIYDAMRGGLTGLGTDEDKLFSVLEQAGPGQLDNLRSAYQAHYHRAPDT